MSNFSDWLSRRLAENDFSSEEDVAGDYEAAMTDLVRTVMSKYPMDITKFLARLADDRGDSELESLLKKVQGRTPTSSWKPKHNPEPEEIVAPKSDKSHDQNAGF